MGRTAKSKRTGRAARRSAEKCRDAHMRPGRTKVESMYAMAGCVDFLGNYLEDIVIFKDPGGRYFFVNSGGLRRLGRKREEVLGKTDSDLFPPHVAKRLAKVESKARRTKAPVREVQVIELRGRDVHFESEVTPILERGGKVVALVLILRDVTRWKTAEEALERTTASLKTMVGRLRTLVNTIPDLVYFKDAEGRNVVVNRAYEEFVGRRQDQILGRTDAELLPPKLAEACRLSDERAYKKRKPVRIEERMEAPDGVHIIDTFKSPLFDAKGRRAGIVGVSRDVTEVRRTGQALKVVEQRLGRVIGDAPVVVHAFDAKGTFTLSEGRGLEALGLKPGEVVGRSVFDVYAHNPAILKEVRPALAGKEVSFVVEEHGRFFETHYAPLLDLKGKLEGTIGVSLDVTDRVQAEKQLARHLEREKSLRAEAEKANRSKDDFLALLSHELRTPMTAMLGWIWLLRSKGMSSTESAEALDTIERNMNMQAQIIEDLLDISRIVTGKLRLECRPVEIGPVLSAAVDVIRPAAQARSLELDVPKRSRSLKVWADPERLQQVFWNLLANAVKFTPEGGGISLRVRKSGRNAEISVADTGEGIDMDKLPYLFAPFTQAEQAITREHGGLGLGLAIANHIMELHGGAIRARSAGEGQGTEFTVSIPLFRPSEHMPAPTRPAGRRRAAFAGSLAKLGGVRVLVVDDEPDTLSMLAMTLETGGARVVAAASAAEAYEAFLKQPPDVMILDITMPQEDGYSLLRRIRKLGPSQGGDVPAAALTARTRAEDRTQVLLSGFQMYLPKPVEPVELAAVVRSLAGKRVP